MPEALRHSRRPRRRVLLGAGLAALLPGAMAQPPLRIVVPSPPGGPQDKLARLLARQLSVMRNEPVLVDNRPGADSAIATEQVIGAQPPDRSLLITSTVLALGAVQGKFHFDPFTDLKPVIQAADMDLMLVARADLPVARPADLIAYMKAGHTVSCGAGIGQMFLACLQLREQLGPGLTAVSFNGIAKLVTTLLGGHIDIGVLPSSDASGHLANGRLQALAISGHASTGAQYAQLPLIGATWPDIDLNSYMGLYAPATASDDAVARWNADLNAILRREDVRRTLATFDMSPVGGSPEVLKTRLRQNRAHFQRLKPLLDAEGR